MPEMKLYPQIHQALLVATEYLWFLTKIELRLKLEMWGTKKRQAYLFALSMQAPAIVWQAVQSFLYSAIRAFLPNSFMEPL